MPVPQFLRRFTAPWVDHTNRINELESRMAADRDMIVRLEAASSKVAAKLSSLIDKVAELDSSVASDAQADAEALRPAVEFLENLGADEAAPVPAEDPVPSDPTPLPDAPAEGEHPADAPASPDEVAPEQA